MTFSITEVALTAVFTSLYSGGCQWSAAISVPRAWCCAGRQPVFCRYCVQHLLPLQVRLPEGLLSPGPHLPAGQRLTGHLSSVHVTCSYDSWI